MQIPIPRKETLITYKSSRVESNGCINQRKGRIDIKPIAAIIQKGVIIFSKHQLELQLILARN